MKALRPASPCDRLGLRSGRSLAAAGGLEALALCSSQALAAAERHHEEAEREGPRRFGRYSGEALLASQSYCIYFNAATIIGLAIVVIQI